MELIVKIYAVRLFINNRWNITRTYADKNEALDFCKSALAGVEWDLKEMELSEALELESSRA